MSSDINKGDDLDTFWTFLNGETKSKGMDEQPKSKDRALSNEEFYSINEGNNDGKPLNSSNIKPESNTQNANSTRRESKIEFELSKALKAIKEIEGFGSVEDSNEDTNIGSDSDDDQLGNGSKDGSDVWTKTGNAEDNDKETEIKKDGRENEKIRDLTLILGNGLDNMTTFMCGGFSLVILLMSKIIIRALATIRTMMHLTIAKAF